MNNYILYFGILIGLYLLIKIVMKEIAIHKANKIKKLNWIKFFIMRS